MTKYSLEEMKEVAHKLAKECKKGQIIAFYGDLGAGKTTFIREFAAFFGVAQELVQSPTFQYVHIYEGKMPIFHFDLYRLNGTEDFFHMGFDDFFTLDGISCIEWAERISSILPKETIHIRIAHNDEASRLITIEGLTCQK